MSGATDWRAPDSVLRVLWARYDMLEAWPHPTPVDLVGEIDRALYQSDKNRLLRFLIKLRNGSPSAMRACERFDRGEIDEDELWRVGSGLST